MSGIEATCEIRAAHPDVSVILLSTYSEADLPADARDCGAIAYVHKEDFGPALVRTLWDASTPDDHRLRDDLEGVASTASGIDPLTRVPSPGALPRRASRRSRQPVGHVHEPVALRRAVARDEAGTVVDDVEAQHVLGFASTTIVEARSPPLRACPRSASLRDSRSRPRLRRRAGSGRRRLPPRPGSTERFAAATSASRRPRSISSGG